MRPRVFVVLIVGPVLFAVLGCRNNAPPPKKFTLPLAKPEKKTALQAEGFGGAIRGKVVYDGEPPKMEFIIRIKDNENKADCLKGSPAETHQQTWMVHPETKAVANIVVWVDPPPGKFFTLREEDKNRPGESVVIDQPHCVFVPHVVAVFPSYFDGAKQVKTGQKLQIKNSATFRHSVQWNPTRENDAFSRPIPPNDKIEVVLNPQKMCLAIGCGDHNWMHGIVWIFDHPYHAVTKEDGTFQIDNLPTGVELTVNVWHEFRLEPFEKRSVTLKAGENPPLEVKVKK